MNSEEYLQQERADAMQRQAGHALNNKYVLLQLSPEKERELQRMPGLPTERLVMQDADGKLNFRPETSGAITAGTFYIDSLGRFVNDVVSIVGRQYTGSNGNQTNHAHSLGTQFTISSGNSLTITDIGAFASGGAAPPSLYTILVQVAASSAPTTILASETFDSASYGVLDAANRIMVKSLSSPLVLGPGTYCVWAAGYGGFYPNYNSTSGGAGSTPTPATFTGVTFASGDFYALSGSPYPTNAGGLGVFYGGATFKGYT